MRLISAAIILLCMISSCDGGGISEGRIPDPKTDKASDRHAPQHARIIAPKVYICGFPIVDNHRIQHSYFVARDNAEYMNPYHVRYNNGRVFTPAEKAMQTLNADTPHRNLDLDLRTEPIELTVSAWEKDRYFSLQMIDANTHHFDYIGNRMTGNGGGTFLIAGPTWKGETPKGITKLIRCETESADAFHHTQLFSPADLAKAIDIQKGCNVPSLLTGLF